MEKGKDMTYLAFKLDGWTILRLVSHNKDIGSAFLFEGSIRLEGDSLRRLDGKVLRHLVIQLDIRHLQQ